MEDKPHVFNPIAKEHRVYESTESCARCGQSRRTVIGDKCVFCVKPAKPVKTRTEFHKKKYEIEEKRELEKIERDLYGYNDY